MAATKNDDLFERVGNLLKEIVLTEDEHPLDDVESMELFRIQQLLFQLWDDYLERLIQEAVRTEADVQTMKEAGASPEDVAAAEKRVRDRLVGRTGTEVDKTRVALKAKLADPALSDEFKANLLEALGEIKKPKLLH